MEASSAAKRSKPNLEEEAKGKRRITTPLSNLVLPEGTPVSRPERVPRSAFVSLPASPLQTHDHVRPDLSKRSSRTPGNLDSRQGNGKREQDAQCVERESELRLYGVKSESDSESHEMNSDDTAFFLA